MSTTSADQQEPTGEQPVQASPPPRSSPVGGRESSDPRAESPDPRADGAHDPSRAHEASGPHDDGVDAADVPHERSTLHMLVRETVIVVGMALLLSLIVKTWLLQAFFIPSASMNDTLVRGDRVIVSKLTPGPFDLERGDIVVFEDPDDWLDPTIQPERGPIGTAVSKTLTFVGLLPNDEGNHLIKRVIGLPGDHVVCCDADGKLTVNGAAVTEPYLRPGDPPSLKTFDITVPAGKAWVMGDHRSDSSDSRFHDPDGTGAEGSVPIDRIVGRAITVVWPLSDWAWLGQPKDTFADVPAPSPATGATPRPSTTGPPDQRGDADVTEDSEPEDDTATPASTDS